MISPEMKFRQGFKLPFTDLNAAKAFGSVVLNQLIASLNDHFSDDQFKITSSEKDSTYVFQLSNDSFFGEIKVIIGWDQTNIDGVISKYLALNITADGYNIHFRESIKSINSLPDKGYYLGAFTGGLLGFIICMAYSYETDDINLLMFMIVMLVFGWIGLHAGTFIGNKLLDSRYDSAQELAMQDTLFLSSSGPWLSFLDKLPSDIQKTIENHSDA